MQCCPKHAIWPETPNHGPPRGRVRCSYFILIILKFVFHIISEIIFRSFFRKKAHFCGHKKPNLHPVLVQFSAEKGSKGFVTHTTPERCDGAAALLRFSIQDTQRRFWLYCGGPSPTPTVLSAERRSTPLGASRVQHRLCNKPTTWQQTSCLQKKKRVIWCIKDAWCCRAGCVGGEDRGHDAVRRCRLTSA